MNIAAASMGNKTVSLCVGVDYAGTSCALRGCVNDAENLSEFLVKTNRVARGDARVLREPTRAEIFAALADLARRTRDAEITQVFLSFSGHGVQVADHDRDEVDGRDEAFCPRDFRTAGVVRDDQLANALGDFNANTRITVLMDCCHSGTMLDLPYAWRTFGKRSAGTRTRGRPVHPNVRMISGCMDAQTSADSYDRARREYTGAMSSCFLDVVKRDPSLLTDCAALVAAMRVLVCERRYTQRPVLTASFDDAHVPFLA